VEEKSAVTDAEQRPGKPTQGRGRLCVMRFNPKFAFGTEHKMKASLEELKS
jgi:hypothetical protein